MVEVPELGAIRILLPGLDSVGAGGLCASGSMEDMFSSSRTTSNMVGLSLVSSKEHLSAKVSSLLMHSDGYGPMVLSMMDIIIPD